MTGLRMVGGDDEGLCADGFCALPEPGARATAASAPSGAAPAEHPERSGSDVAG